MEESSEELLSEDDGVLPHGDDNGSTSYFQDEETPCENGSAVNQNEETTDTSFNEDEAERRHFIKILTAFRHYYVDAMRRVDTNERCFRQLPMRHQSILEDFPSHLRDVRQCIRHNARLIEEITKEASCIFTNASPYSLLSQSDEKTKLKISQSDMDKVRSTLKQLVRDWSEAGQTEREQCYSPVIESIRRFFPEPSSEIRILVPGAGLGRLAWEIAKLGYMCQGNEWSLYMLIASNFVLNRCSSIKQFSIYPWSYQFCNNEARADQLQEIRFPDVNPMELPKQTEFSMAAGDFLEVYQEPQTWDCVATVFFIDTAHNVVAYVESFWNLLKPGGYWINIGPLLYHYADVPGEVSIELTYEDLRKVIERIGFQYVMEQRRYPTRYTQNANSMLQYIYNSVFFVVRKPIDGQSCQEVLDDN